jgi:hypothetical protein
MTTAAAAPAAPTSTTPTGTVTESAKPAAAVVTESAKPSEPVKTESVKAEPAKTEKAPEPDILSGETTTTEAKEPDSTAQAGEIEITVPEGVELDKGLLDKFKPIAKELKLDSKGAQKFVDLYTQAISESNTQAEAAWNDQKQAWRDSAMKDPEFGGPKFKENVAVALKAIDKFGGPELRKAFNELGIGNHPEIIRFAYRAGKAISEDSIVHAGRPPTLTDEQTKLRQAFPSMFPQDK